MAHSSFRALYGRGIQSSFKAASRGFFSIIASMNQKIPGILFLLAMPCSVLLYIKVETLSGSEILGLLSAVALYFIVALIIAFVFNKNDKD